MEDPVLFCQAKFKLMKILTWAKQVDPACRERLAGQMWILVRLNIFMSFWGILFIFWSYSLYCLGSAGNEKHWCAKSVRFHSLHCSLLSLLLFLFYKLLTFPQFHRESESVYSICTREIFAQSQYCTVHTNLGYFRRVRIISCQLFISFQNLI